MNFQQRLQIRVPELQVSVEHLFNSRVLRRQIIDWVVCVPNGLGCYDPSGVKKYGGAKTYYVEHRKSKKPGNPSKGLRFAIGISPVLVFELFGLGGHLLRLEYSFYGGGAI